MNSGAFTPQQRVTLVLTIAIGLIIGGGSVALSASTPPPTVSSTSASALTQVRVVRDINPASTSSQNYVDVPGASTTISVPTGTKALIIARFSAASTCPGPVADASCFVRIMIGSLEALPSGVNKSIFDTEVVRPSNALFLPLQAHEIERTKGGLTPGNYVVKVQMAVADADATLSLVNWNLTVERFRV